MLKVTIPAVELFNEQTSEFIQIKETVLCLEHSLLSVSNWEAIWHKPYIDPKRTQLTAEELVSYIKCMTINKDVPDVVYKNIPASVYKQIQEYIEDQHTATKMYNLVKPKKTQQKPMTSEDFYYAMFTYQIPKECEKWHLNKLIALIEVFSYNNGGKDSKMSRKENATWQAAENARRRAKLHSKG